MKPKTEFRFRALQLDVKQTCQSPVAASVRKSSSRWVIIRIDKSTSKIIQFAGKIISVFFDEDNRALLLLTDQTPIPSGARKAYQKDGSSYIELPRQKVLEEWFPVGPIRPLTLVEVSHGRLVVQVPK